MTTFKHYGRRGGDACPVCADAKLGVYRNKQTRGWFLACPKCPFRCEPNPEYARELQIARRERLDPCELIGLAKAEYAELEEELDRIDRRVDGRERWTLAPECPLDEEEYTLWHAMIDGRV